MNQYWKMNIRLINLFSFLFIFYYTSFSTPGSDVWIDSTYIHTGNEIEFIFVFNLRNNDKNIVFIDSIYKIDNKKEWRYKTKAVIPFDVEINSKYIKRTRGKLGNRLNLTSFRYIVKIKSEDDLSKLDYLSLYYNLGDDWKRYSFSLEKFRWYKRNFSSGKYHIYR